MLSLEQKKENEKFFLRVLLTLNEGGMYVYPAQMAFFTKRDGKLYATAGDLEKVKDIVTADFFSKFFVLK